jgi:hypothetical protein
MIILTYINNLDIEIIRKIIFTYYITVKAQYNQVRHRVRPFFYTSIC